MNKILDKRGHSTESTTSESGSLLLLPILGVFIILVPLVMFLAHFSNPYGLIALSKTDDQEQTDNKNTSKAQTIYIIVSPSKYIFYQLGKEPIELEQTAPDVKKKFSTTLNKWTNKKLQDNPIVIEPSGKVLYGQIIETVNICTESGFNTLAVRSRYE